MQEVSAKDQVFYDKLWKEWDDMHYYSPAPRIRRERIIALLKKVPFKSLLDVGCGNGEFLKDVGNSIGNISLAGADISSNVIESTSKRFKDMKFYQLNLNEETLPEKFDVVTSLEVIEHCCDYTDSVRRLAEMTRGRLIISVPCGPVFAIDRIVGHTKHFTAKEIQNAIEKAGLRVINIQCWGFPFFNLYKHAINISPEKMTESFMSEKPYTWKHKLLSNAVHSAFKLCFPWGGYQLFAEAQR
ncbi:MAG: class I SAM-dependent methyltransferase [Nitrospirae bacterium]|nr:class I SAM-dependent methyltransferase [Nitrospirota bacterium]MBF0534449.1 class I SAM-dependent methyltransferase [Nitrospirota bacterium]MBF0617075.1 class I SAM-dependent methyltransferase [Nitrospirota bacterium]